MVPAETNWPHVPQWPNPLAIPFTRHFSKIFPMRLASSKKPGPKRLAARKSRQRVSHLCSSSINHSAVSILLMQMLSFYADLLMEEDEVNAQAKPSAKGNGDQVQVEPEANGSAMKAQAKSDEEEVSSKGAGDDNEDSTTAQSMPKDNKNDGAEAKKDPTEDSNQGTQDDDKKRSAEDGGNNPNKKHKGEAIIAFINTKPVYKECVDEILAIVAEKKGPFKRVEVADAMKHKVTPQDNKFHYAFVYLVKTEKVYASDEGRGFYEYGLNMKNNKSDE